MGQVVRQQISVELIVLKSRRPYFLDIAIIVDGLQPTIRRHLRDCGHQMKPGLEVPL
jgi:hypothetical protein